jgi:hypothetical protein
LPEVTKWDIHLHNWKQLMKEIKIY